MYNLEVKHINTPCVLKSCCWILYLHRELYGNYQCLIKTINLSVTSPMHFSLMKAHLYLLRSFLQITPLLFVYVAKINQNLKVYYGRKLCSTWYIFFFSISCYKFVGNFSKRALFKATRYTENTFPF
jgi:hypothetical protein